MIEQKHKLPNGNTFIWLGNQPIHGCENVLVLAGGDVLFLQTHQRLVAEKLKEDIQNLNQAEFLQQYGWPNNSSGKDLYWELREAGINSQRSS